MPRKFNKAMSEATKIFQRVSEVMIKYAVVIKTNQIKISKETN